jgi:hypothetical protein
VVIPHVDANGNTALPAELTRLPRNQKEGDIPLMAVATAYIDTFECVLRKMGIDLTEFNNETGRVHFYQTFGEMGSKGATLGPSTRPASDLWDNPAELKKYDMVLLPCEAHEVIKTPEETQNIINFANAGGRVFATHYGYTWLEKAQTPFPSTATWHPDDPMNDPFPTDVVATVDTTFPKGKALSEWLSGFQLAPAGLLPIHEARHDVDDATRGISQSWVSTADPQHSVQAFTFNTPVGVDADNQCGRVVYTNFHVADALSVTGQLFPQECDAAPMTAQERVLEFMLFDLASCVQPDPSAPVSPK